MAARLAREAADLAARLAREEAEREAIKAERKRNAVKYATICLREKLPPLWRRYSLRKFMGQLHVACQQGDLTFLRHARKTRPQVRGRGGRAITGAQTVPPGN